MIKLVIAGAGAYEFAPAILDDLFVNSRTSCELWLVDGDIKTCELTARCAQQMAKFADVTTKIFYTSQLPSALPGADYVVFCQDFVDPARWMKDQKALADVGLSKQMRTMGGLGGAMHALRCVGLTVDVAEQMEKLCPNATLILCSGPVARMAEAAQRYCGIRTLGLSAAPLEAQLRIAKTLERKLDGIAVTCAGLPGLSFVLSATDEGGNDLISKTVTALKKNDYEKLAVDHYDWYGALTADLQGWEMLPDTIESPLLESPPFSGSGMADYNVRMRQMATIATQGMLSEEGLKAWNGMRKTAGPIRPVQLIHALRGKIKSLHLPALCAPNNGAIDCIAQARFVQTAASITNGEIKQENAILPAELDQQLERVSSANLLYARAGAYGDRVALREALEEDPSTDGIDLLYAQDVVSRMIEEDKEALHCFINEG